MDVRCKFLGASGEVTGSKYLLQVDGFNLLVDCGLFQGRKELRLLNRDPFPVDPRTIDAIVLTHAHLDHTGYLPRLYRDGCRAPIYCTAATADLMDLILMDSARIQEEEARYARKKGYSKHADPEPLYTTGDLVPLRENVWAFPFNEPVRITSRIRARFHHAGHILGAAIVELTLTGTREEKTIEKIRLAVLDNGMGSTRLLQECKGTSGRDHVIVELLYPTALDSLLGQSHQGSLGGLGSGPNAFSCIYRLVYEGRRILVPGDADMSALRRLALASPERLNCDLLVAPHHGKPQNASASGLSFQDLAALFRSQVAFVSNSSSARKANWPPDDDFIKALAASPTSVVCAELTPTCQCGGMVRGPLGRGARLMGLSNSDRDSRACMGTLRVELRGGTLHYPDLEYHATNIRGNRYIKLAAPCLRADS